MSKLINMFGCNDVVTLWRRRFNADTKKDEYTRSVIPVLCRWKSHSIRIAAESGAVVKQYVTVIIPYIEWLTMICGAIGKETEKKADEYIENKYE